MLNILIDKQSLSLFNSVKILYYSILTIQRILNVKFNNYLSFEFYKNFGNVEQR